MADRPGMSNYMKVLLSRAQANGGFSAGAAGPDRVDATSWAAVLLSITDSESPVLRAARRRLVAAQLEDGRVSVAIDHPDAFWPTGLAIMAWGGDPSHEQNKSRAIEFLLKTSGRHFPKQPDSVMGHDTALRGWPWISDTHSWVEITALNMIALASAGYGSHSRIDEALKMIVDRQLPAGGWNVGNTTAFGQELRPSPESTGAALAALAGRVPEALVARSIEYLTRQVAHRRTPIALGWSVLGLSAWNRKPSRTLDHVVETLQRIERFGEYDTASLCILLTALVVPAGLGAALQRVDRNSSAV